MAATATKNLLNFVIYDSHQSGADLQGGPGTAGASAPPQNDPLKYDYSLVKSPKMLKQKYRHNSNQNQRGKNKRSQSPKNAKLSASYQQQQFVDLQKKSRADAANVVNLLINELPSEQNRYKSQQPTTKQAKNNSSVMPKSINNSNSSSINSQHKLAYKMSLEQRQRKVVP